MARGRKKLNSELKRNHCVSVRLNSSELEMLDSARSGIQRGTYLRMCFNKTTPKQVPEINISAWQELSKAAANLNQIALHLNSNSAVDFDEINMALADFRSKLLS
jgi:hypothetical protein